MASELILNKIKLLMNLANSPCENEAKNARDMADKLIAKYNISPEDLKTIEDKKPAYEESQRLYTTLGIESWRNQLALGICSKNECFLIQEEAVPMEGLSQFSYFVVGEPEQVEIVKVMFAAFEKKAEELIIRNCLGKSADYSHSYSEGLVEGIKSNLDYVDIDVPRAVNMPGPAATLTNGGDANITKHGEKEKPLKETINIASQSFIKDVVAYFKGIADGNRLSLQDILELAQYNSRPNELKE